MNNVTNSSTAQAVVDTWGNCACIAVPGSGKSHTRVHHIVERLHTAPNCYYQAISFTRKAAAKLRERIIREIGHDRYKAQVNVSTFDSLFIKPLKNASSGKEIQMMTYSQCCWST